ncbi:uncharacterized protein VTP21DRAFT_7778 [Calcarisporiella thermophila]|uniref:uncharacterized protein n=1 Tax=Calcarisporiella thermophila TaxID=911321 RepID=UPI003744AE15
MSIVKIEYGTDNNHDFSLPPNPSLSPEEQPKPIMRWSTTSPPSTPSTDNLASDSEFYPVCLDNPEESTPDLGSPGQESSSKSPESSLLASSTLNFSPPAPSPAIPESALSEKGSGSLADSKIGIGIQSDGEFPPDEDQNEKMIPKVDPSRKTRNVQRWVTVLVSVVIIGALGCVIWVVVSAVTLKHSNESNSVDTNGGLDLSTVVDKRLKKSFYGITYAPFGSQSPDCSLTLKDVVEDLKVLGQMTTRLRLYGFDCNTANYTLQAIKLLHLPMGVQLTLPLDDTPNTFERNLVALTQNMITHGPANIDSISVGNEYLARSIYPPHIAITTLYQAVGTTRNLITQLGLGIPVYAADSNLIPEVVEMGDGVVVNARAFYAGLRVEDVVQELVTFWRDKSLELRGIRMILGEVGWPIAGPPFRDAVANPQTQSQFLSSFLCTANALHIPYYYFDAIDQPDKQTEPNTLWGILDEKRRLKENLNIPGCVVDGWSPASRFSNPIKANNELSNTLFFARPPMVTPTIPPQPNPSTPTSTTSEISTTSTTPTTSTSTAPPSTSLTSTSSTSASSPSPTDAGDDASNKV